MRAPWRRRPTPRTRRQLAESGLGARMDRELTDLSACREGAYRVAGRRSSSLEPVLAVAEDMLLDEANYEVVVALLENMQNLVSHDLAMFWTCADVERLLGPKSMVCWETLNTFWNAVAAWCVLTGLPMEPGEDILGAENEELRKLLWTSNRTLPTGEKIGLAHAIRFEKAGQPAIPGFGHIAAALDMDASGG